MTKDTRCGVVLLVGGGGSTRPVEQALRQARQAAALDLIDRVRHVDHVSPIVVISDDPTWLGTLSGADLRTEATQAGKPFHFGRALADAVSRHQLRACLYLGGGSAPLISGETFEKVVCSVFREQPILVTNNLHSSDWAAFAPADAIIPLVPWLARDNALGWVWQEKAHLPVRALPRTTATQMDIDTPFDLLALARHPAISSHLRGFLMQLEWAQAQTHVERALDVLRRPASQLIIAGRVPSWTWQLLERHTRIWVRVFSEERGMRASGRQARCEVRSLLNEYLELVGVERFFESLADMADAILLDSRVLLASRYLWPSDADRFCADLLLDDKVDDPFLRALTRAARVAPMPVVMGGHSLVSGGLAVLLEAAGLVPVS